jgi:hypothetical protein
MESAPQRQFKRPSFSALNSSDAMLKETSRMKIASKGPPQDPAARALLILGTNVSRTHPPNMVVEVFSRLVMGKLQVRKKKNMYYRPSALSLLN